MRQAVLDDCVAESVYLLRGDEVPQFSCQGEVLHFGLCFVVACRLLQHADDERFVHDDFLTVGVEVSFCQFHSLAQHDAEGEAGHLQVVGNLQGGADGVAVFHKGLQRKVGVVLPEGCFAFGSAVYDNALRAACLCYGHALADALNEGLFGERLHDARHTDDAEAAFDAETGVERLLGEWRG